MTDFNIATGEEQPLNRTGVDNVQITGKNQGVPVGIDTSGVDPQLVAADAGTGVAAVGVLFPREVIPSNVEGYVTEHPWENVEEQIYKENRTLSGDRATVVRYGIEMVNDDNDTSWTPGETVYLAAGGGFTNTPPSGDGDLVQEVGVVLTEQEGGVNPNNDGQTRIMLTVGESTEVVGEAVFSGDGTKTTFSIAHGLPSAPSRFEVEATSAEAAYDYYVTVDATNIDVTFSTAPASGTDNVTLHWEAQE